MGVLHVWAMVAGLLTIGLPVAVHFLTRPKPMRFPLSTIRFVQQAVDQKKSRHRLRDFIILALRTLAVALLALTFARPIFENLASTKIGDDSSLQRVVILDVSQSMAAVTDGIPAIERARVIAADYLSGYQTSANLILAGASPQALFEMPSRNLNLLRDVLAEAAVEPQRIDVSAALKVAGQMLQAVDDNTKTELVIVSDFQRSNWASANFSAIPESCEILFRSVAPQEQADNLGVVDVRFAERAIVGEAVNLEIDLVNFSSVPQICQCSVELDDTSFLIQETCAANSTTTLIKEIEITNSGWKTGVASLLENQDALREDDVLPFALLTESASDIKIVTRTRSQSKRNSTFYLERALNPYSEKIPGQPTVDRVLTGQFDSQSMGQSPLLIFDHPGKLSDQQIEMMASVVRRGRNVLYFASELLDANNLKLFFNELSGDLQSPVEFLPPGNKSSRKDLSIVSVQNKSRPFYVFGDALNDSISGLRFSGGLDTRNLPDGIDEDVLARLSDQSALVFVTRAGAGSVGVVNADLDRSNLIRHQAFVPLVNELIDLLMETGGRRETSYCGETLTRVLPASVQDPDRLRFEPLEMGGVLRRSGIGVVWTNNNPIGPGLTKILDGEECVFAISTTIPPEESDLRALDGDTLTERLATGRMTSFHGVGDRLATIDYGWVWCAVLVLILMIVEVGCLTWFKT